MDDYTNNELALLDLLNDINKTFYYLGEEGDDVDQFEIDKLHKIVDNFASKVTISDSQEQVEYL
jgi:hypothetical protein